MGNMRILYNNAADSTLRSTLTTTGAITTLPVTNLLNDYKARVWRSTDFEPTIDIRWGAGAGTQQPINMVCLPYTNLTGTGQMRVRAYDSLTNPTPFLDTTFLPCCPYDPLATIDWGGGPIGVNAYSYGGGVYAVLYFGTLDANGRHTPINAARLQISIRDPSNTAGYYEAMRLLIGAYWEPEINAAYGANIKVLDNSKSERNDAGDLMSDRSTISKSLSFSLDAMSIADRAVFWRIMRGRGLSKPLFVTLSPENLADPSFEQENHVYGKLVQLNPIAIQGVNLFTGSITIEEI